MHIWELITMVWMERRREGKRRLGHKACGVDAVRRAVGCAGAERKTQQGGVPKRRCRQPGGHGGQEHAEATDGRLNRATRAVDSVAWMLCGGGMG